MKKILGVIILSLLMSGCATAPSSVVQDTLIKEGNIKIGMKYTNLLQALGGEGAVFPIYPMGYEKNYKHMYASPGYLGYDYDTKYYSFEHPNPPAKWGWSGPDIESYRLTKIWDESVPMINYYINLSKNEKDRNYLVKLKSAALENKKTTSTASSSSINTADKITQSKQVCTDLGFQPKTEKHADCSMQMMSIQFETTNKVASASGGTTQEVIVTHRNDYDIWDALVDYSRAIDPANKSTSSSSSNRGTSCFAQTTTGGHTIMNCN